MPAAEQTARRRWPRLNSRTAKVDLVIYVSDNESWVDARRQRPGNGDDAAVGNVQGRATRRRKMVCIDLVPNTTTQAASRPTS